MESDSNSAEPTLVDRLQSFNRKERYWVIRNALGTEGQPLPLSPQFRETLQQAVNRPVPENAWWGMDYHLNWLFATALLLNDPEQHSGENEISEKLFLIEGNQEDVDLIVAFEKTMIVLEAKCTGSWTSKQNDSKTERLDRLRGMLPDDIELFIVYWAPDKRNSSNKLADGSIKMRLWMDREDGDFWLINRDSAEGKRWVIRPKKR